MSDDSGGEPVQLADASVIDALKLELAAQAAPRSWRTVLRSIAKGIQDGEPLEELVERLGSALAPELKQIFRGALQIKDPVGFVHEAINVRQRSRVAWREFTWAIAYPLLLFTLALCVALVFDFCMQTMVSVEWMDELELSGTDAIKASFRDQTNAILGLAIAAAWCGIVLATLYFAGPSWAWISVIGGLIIVGKPIRWIALEELLERYRLFFAFGMNPTQAADAVAKTMASSGQAIVARRVARQVSDGVPIGEAIGSSVFADKLSRPIIRLLDSESQLSMEAKLENTAGLLHRITSQRCQTLITILPFFALLMTGTLILSSLWSYATALQPLIKLITSLA